MVFSNEKLSNQLYRAVHSEGGAFGSDSLALDIQRSRDHGLQGYVKYVSLCKGQDVNSWNDLEAVMETKVRNMRLRSYERG